MLNTAASIEAGRLYLRHCTECHGADGRAVDGCDRQRDRRSTEPAFVSGMAAASAEIHRSIDEGAGGDAGLGRATQGWRGSVALVNFSAACGRRSSVPQSSSEFCSRNLLMKNEFDAKQDDNSDAN
ncbi:MAG: hypothetical protein IPF49_03680 [Gammaproteobacteria bacterium]|nr:hypothetical protein [Gammaproteobacteria bacterium]